MACKAATLCHHCEPLHNLFFSKMRYMPGKRDGQILIVNGNNQNCSTLSLLQKIKTFFRIMYWRNCHWGKLTYCKIPQNSLWNKIRIQNYFCNLLLFVCIMGIWYFIGEKNLFSIYLCISKTTHAILLF